MQTRELEKDSVELVAKDVFIFQTEPGAINPTYKGQIFITQQIIVVEQNKEARFKCIWNKHSPIPWLYYTTKCPKEPQLKTRTG